MSVEWETAAPGEIERRSFEIIQSELGRPLEPETAPIVLRVIHATADFSFADSLAFSPDALSAAREALCSGARVVTDTNMARAGIHAPALAKLGGSAVCFIADPDVAKEAKARGITRAAVSMERARDLPEPLVFAIGNAPTALMRMYELIETGALSPALVIGAPVGFVNVVQSKELIMRASVPYIVAQGRKGGSGVAAAIVNALLYMAAGRDA